MQYLRKHILHYAYAIQLAVLAILCFAFQVSTAGAQSQSILVIVNDEPITAFDVSERIKLKLLSSRDAQAALKRRFKSPRTKEEFTAFMRAARPTSREEAVKVRNRFIKKLRSEVQRAVARKMRKSTLEELIDERLMLQEAKKQNQVVSEDEVTKRLKTLASRNKDKKTGRPLTVKQFLGNLSRVGVSERTFKARMKASMAFQRVVLRKYGRRMQYLVGDSQIDRVLASTAGVSKNTQFRVQKVQLALAQNANQATIARKLIQAEELRNKFKSCKTTETLVKAISGGSVQSLGSRTTKQLPKEARALFAEAKAGDMTPPRITASGIEMYAVCSRRSVAGDDKKRAEVKNKLRQQEFQLLRRRYLRDLRQDAYIDYRTS